MRKMVKLFGLKMHLLVLEYVQYYFYLHIPHKILLIAKIYVHMIMVAKKKIKKLIYPKAHC